MIDEKSQQHLMDYLFDEMSSYERKEFEQKLQNSKELRNKLNELKATQSVIGNYSPEEAQLPGFIFQDHTQKRESSGKSRWIHTAGWAAAAAILITIFIGLFSSVQFGQTEQGFYLTFGNPPIEVEQGGISEEELNEIITQIRTENSLMMTSMM